MLVLILFKVVVKNSYHLLYFKLRKDYFKLNLSFATTIGGCCDYTIQ